MGGPGRWGSSDTWLGIPVKWPHISAARVIVEAGLTNYRVDPSQGTHFFQNLTSFGVGYFTINAYMNDGIYNQDFLNAQPALHETEFLRNGRQEETRCRADAGNLRHLSGEVSPEKPKKQHLIVKSNPRERIYLSRG